MKQVSGTVRIAALTIAGMACNNAMACDEVYSNLQSAAGTPSYHSTLISLRTSYPGCFNNITPADTPQQQIRATTFTQIGFVSQSLGMRLLAPPVASMRTADAGGPGLAAGGAPGWNAWGSYANDMSGYRVSRVTVTGAPGSPFNIDNQNTVNNIVLGGDYALAPTMVLGVSAAFDNGKGYVTPDSTNLTTRSNTSGNGQTIAAYVGWQINKNWATDVTVGGGVATSTPARASTVESTRRFAGANLTYANWIGNWQLTGKAGYQFGAEQFENARRSGVSLPLTYYTSRLGQAKVGGEIGYFIGDGVMPYVGASYVRDVSRNQAQTRVSQLFDKDSVMFTVGMNFFSVKNNLTAGVAYTEETGRNYVSHGNWMANLNYRF